MSKFNILNSSKFRYDIHRSEKLYHEFCSYDVCTDNEKEFFRMKVLDDISQHLRSVYRAIDAGFFFLMLINLICFGILCAYLVQFFGMPF